MNSKNCRKIFKIFENAFIERHLPFLISGLAIFSGFLTYSIVSYGGVSLAKRTSTVMPFIIFDMLIIVILTIIIIDRVKIMYREQKRGAIGARLHITIISIFSLVTITPSILMGILAITFFKSGVSVWFSQPVQHTLSEASLVAELYLQEHIGNIRTEAINFATRLNVQNYDLFKEKDRNDFREELDALVDKMHLEEALVQYFDTNRKESVSISSSLAIYLELDYLTRHDADWVDLRNVDLGEVLIREKNGQVQALICVDTGRSDATMYLWIGKIIDRNILKYVTTARDSTRYYNELLNNQNQFQLVLVILFALASVLLLLAAVWTGITLANILVSPITRLIVAANDVSEGDLTVRVPEVHSKNELNKLVQSFNRMTERLARQNKDLIISEKKSAWADIARKIAHEVKNPLTPIQLSAERLKRKYKAEIRSDPETFIKCIDTIIRQVSHIENLISEFSAFARMPEANIELVNINHLVRDAVFLQRQADPDIDFSIEASHPLIICPCDSQQIFQVLVNLLQNAVNAIKERDVSAGEEAHGAISVFLLPKEDHLLIVIEDNGPGFPAEKRERLFEPYYTTRSKGTGLGMSIVLRIVAEHAGT
ncbi:MAG: HAMP domain-containing protein, partial [Holosporales bacterium]|nr:HAMP domain-containing protein [Holosporales bacterium]